MFLGLLLIVAPLVVDFEPAGEHDGMITYRLTNQGSEVLHPTALHGWYAHVEVLLPDGRWTLLTDRRNCGTVSSMYIPLHPGQSVLVSEYHPISPRVSILPGDYRFVVTVAREPAFQNKEQITIARRFTVTAAPRSLWQPVRSLERSCFAARAIASLIHHAPLEAWTDLAPVNKRAREVLAYGLDRRPRMFEIRRPKKPQKEEPGVANIFAEGTFKARVELPDLSAEACEEPDPEALILLEKWTPQIIHGQIEHRTEKVSVR